MASEKVKIVINPQESRGPEGSIIRDAEKVRAGEAAEAAEREAELADGVDLPLDPDDISGQAAEGEAEADRSIDFDDDGADPDDHGRNLV